MHFVVDQSFENCEDQLADTVAETVLLDLCVRLVFTEVEKHQGHRLADGKVAIRELE